MAIDGSQEHIHHLDTAQIAYAHNGDPSSRTVVLFSPGLLSVGTAKHVPDCLTMIPVHWISITPPGMGNTTPTPINVPYHVHLTRLVSSLLDALHPDGFDRLFVSGGSYGTVLAQMLYGASYDLFPHGRKIAGCLIMACFSPFKHHKNYASSLTWPNYISVGPPSQLFPYRLLPRLLSYVFASKLSTLDGAKTFLDQALFSKMDEEESARFDAYLTRVGETKESFIENMAHTNLRSIEHTWEGFLEVSDVIHSDWGFDPAILDDDHSKPILIVGADQDDLGNELAQWLVAMYKASRWKCVPGGHIAGLFFQEEMWKEMLEMTGV